MQFLKNVPEIGLIVLRKANEVVRLILSKCFNKWGETMSGKKDAYYESKVQQFETFVKITTWAIVATVVTLGLMAIFLT